MPDITINKFNPRSIDITKPKVMAFVGRRGSGKSTLCEDILYYFRSIPEGVVFSPTEDGNQAWRKHFPATFIFDDYEPSVMSSVIRKKKKEGRKHRKNPHKYPLRPIHIVAEDCMYDKTKFVKDPNTRYVMMNGRHVGIWLWITVQYMMDLGRELRSQIDYLFVTSENVIGNRERLWKNWFGVIPTFRAFNTIMDSCTEDYGCIVLDNTCTSRNISDCVFWYRAQKVKPYKVGSPEYWMYHYVNYNSESDSDSDNENAYSGRKNRMKRRSHDDEEELRLALMPKNLQERHLRVHKGYAKPIIRPPRTRRTGRPGRGITHYDRRLR